MASKNITPAAEMMARIIVTGPNGYHKEVLGKLISIHHTSAKKEGADMLGFLKRIIQPKTQVQQWKHGWETSLVRATRYTNKEFGFNIGFSLPRHPYDCGRADMMEWLRSEGVRVYQCGGHPGAEILGIIEGVSDVSSANKWLPVFLPKFDSWVRKNLRN